MEMNSHYCTSCTHNSTYNIQMPSLAEFLLYRSCSKGKSAQLVENAQIDLAFFFYSILTF